MESLKEVKRLLRTMDHFVQSFNRVLRILNLFILSGQPVKRAPGEEFGLGLKRGAEFFEQPFYPIFFVGLDIDDGGLRQDESLQILQNLLFLGGFFHKINEIIAELILNVNFISGLGNSIHNSPHIADFRLKCCILKEDTKNNILGSCRHLSKNPRMKMSN